MKVTGTFTLTIRTVGDVARYLVGPEAAALLAREIRRLALPTPQATLELHRLGIKTWYLDPAHAAELARVRRRLKRQLAVRGTGRGERGTAGRGGACGRASSRVRR